MIYPKSDKYKEENVMMRGIMRILQDLFHVIMTVNGWLGVC
jgi:hypothetical protein